MYNAFAKSCFNYQPFRFRRWQEIPWEFEQTLFFHNTVTFGRNEWNDTVYKWMNWRNWKQWTRSNICWWFLIYEIKVLMICRKDLVKCGFMKLGELTNFLFTKHTIHRIGSGFWAIYFGPGLLRRLLDCDPNGQYPSRFARATCTQMIRPLWKDRSVGKSTLHFLKQKNGHTSLPWRCCITGHLCRVKWRHPHPSATWTGRCWI